MTAKLSTTVETILWHACRKAGKCSSSCFALIDGSRVSREQTLMSTEIENGEEIIVLTERLGGKPVIYLHSPNEITASVKLSLIPEWDFSVIYPSVPIKQHRGQHIEWTVRTQTDGSLVETNTGTDVTYLFWEAE